MSEYDANYFLCGKQTGLSLYENYRWLPELTLPMTRAIVDHLRIKYSDTILDFGCARGYVVRALRELRYTAFGYDTSEWAIANCDPKVCGLLSTDLGRVVDWVIAKDVLEHVLTIQDTIGCIMETARRGIFAVVPLADIDGARYVVPDYEKDVTHIHRLTLASWAKMFTRPGWSVELRYRLKGVKDNYYQAGWERGNGFITARRLEQ